MTDNRPNLEDYAAKTEFTPHKIVVPFLKRKKNYPIGLDVGYSSTKTYSIYGKYIFPSLPIRVSDDFSMISGDSDIRYKDEKGNVWYVGSLARTELDQGKIQTQTETLFGRQRINSSEFLVLLRVGLFFGLIKEDKGDRYELATNQTPIIKTGLPDQYISRDRKTLKQKVSGHHHFHVKIGDKDWQTVSIDIDESNVSVISQPFGTLWSLVANRYGEFTNIGLLEKNVLIYDGGHHTTDTYFNKSGLKGITNTWENLSMIEIIRATRKNVRKETGEQGDFQDYSFDKIVSSTTPGKIRYGKRQVYDISSDVLDITESVAKEAIEQLDVIYDYLNETDVLVLTGGVGKAFYPYFAKHYANKGLEVLLAEKEDDPDPVNNFDVTFANVVGFFNNLIYELKELEPAEQDYEKRDEALPVITDAEEK